MVVIIVAADAVAAAAAAVSVGVVVTLARDKMPSGADLNGDNLQISGAYLRIRDRCRVMVRVRVGVADCCIQTARESDKMRINHVIKTSHWRAAPQIRPLRILSCPGNKSVSFTSAGLSEIFGW